MCNFALLVIIRSDASAAALYALFPLMCANVQYHQITWAVKSHSRRTHEVATFQNIGKVRKQGEAI